MFLEITRRCSLSTAWQRVRRNGGSPGADGMTVHRFDINIDKRLNALMLELRTRVYQPGPLKSLSIPKRSGGERTLRIPCVRDRVVHTAIANSLSTILEPEFEDESYGYRPGRSVAMAVNKVAYLRRQGFTCVVDADIYRFFDNVFHDRLLEKLSNHVGERTCQLVSTCLASFSSEGTGLAQGSPLSPILANLYLDGFDESVSACGFRLVRYADDFVLLTRTVAEAHDGLAHVNEELARIGLSLNTQKTRVLDHEESFAFLGKRFLRSLVFDEARDKAPRGRSTTTIHTRRTPTPDTISTAITGMEVIAPEPTSDATHSAGLRPLYIVTSGAILKESVSGFTVWLDDQEQISLPVRQVGRIDLGPGAQADTDAIRRALNENIPINYVGYYGEQIGTLSSSHDHHAGLFLAQASVVNDPIRRQIMARSLVGNRIHNQRALLKRLNARRKLSAVSKACEKLKSISNQLDRPRLTVEQLMGYEGAAGAVFWPAIGHLLLHGVKFEKRIRHPAPDMVNAVLDWTSSLLSRDVAAALSQANLHPGIGILHSTSDYQDALVYDLVEQFRAPLVESTTVYLFNNRMLDAQSGVMTRNGFRFDRSSASIVIRTYENTIARSIKSPRGHSTSWRQLIIEQCQAFAQSIRQGTDYQPYRMDY